MSIAEVSGPPETAGSSGDSRVSAKRILQRIILPREIDPVDARPLYLDEPDGVHCDVASRRSMTVPASSRVSFATYFNAFAASYWQRWSRLDEVVLRMSVRGAGRVEVFHSRWHGEAVYVDGSNVTGGKWTDVEFRIPLTAFSDGGWIWFDVNTEDAALEVAEAAWTTDEELAPVRLAVGTTTFNRPDDTLAMLQALAEDEIVLSRVGKIFVADQGTKKVREHPRFAEVSAVLGDRLEVIDQPNIGGSGGFTRTFYETLGRTDVDQVLLLDDDIFLEPDSVLRASAFAAAASEPLIVGGQMLNLLARSRLHSMGEAIDLYESMWGPAPGAKVDHDFAETSLRDEPDLHRRIDANYNGWWMCLFPRQVIEDVGLPLPLFIKWDDAEYGLRALAAGYPTVTLPGAGVWHMPWTSKNDTFDWTLYFHRRNRLVTAALYGGDVRKPLLLRGLRDQFKRLMAMEYSSVAMEIKAVEDFLAGPEKLFGQLETALPDVQKLRSKYPDAQLTRSAQDFPLPSMDVASANRLLEAPRGKARILARAAKVVLRNLKAPAPESVERPQMNVPSDKLLWFLLGNLDSAVVSLPDGQSVAFRKRDPKTFRDLALGVFHCYRKLARDWPKMQRRYKAAMPQLTSAEAWRKVYNP